MKPQLVLRVARPTNDLAAVIRFYRDGLGLQELFRFSDHDGFDGVMLGQPGDAYHFDSPTRMVTMPAGRPRRTIWSSSTSRIVTPGKPPSSA
ncbi:hypothetical protein GCM10007881_29440 [Mesorhizobium huakuii]|uniref:VOC family protein n=1 Tax=Mesorhizobium huakuii TaxID=28104 RepID=UPI00235D1B7E|nr:hypothetical protein GCM10007881_29440 [Mesorhizobium huakuii]